ncbi:MAG: RagB/SusD family nutrient uptake outer membrane protein [Bacteroidaceae bacterium]|nr:RagB/SusD family nutrient uptake outer membrane protein [Bacteroidaceae bacterium]
MNNNKTIIVRIARSAKALLLGTMVAMTCSCDDFLTISPTDKIVLEDFWKSKEDVESMVAESYRMMSHWNFLSRVVVWGELRGDNVVEGNYGNNTDIKNIMEANLLPSNSYNSWDAFYSVINNCNQVLKYAPGVLDEDPDFTQGDLNVVRGEMLAVRALCHFYLVRTFRDIPLLTEAMVDDSQNLYQMQVDPIVALDSCLNDLKEAENLVLTTGNYPVNNEINNKNMGRITKDAVRTIIADVNLWKAAFLEWKAGGDDAAGVECYKECIEYCDKVLNARMRYAENWLKENRKGNDDIELHASYPIVYASDATDGYEKDKRFEHVPYTMSFGGGLRGCNNPIESVFELQHTEREADGNYEVPYFYSYSNDGKACQVGMLSAARNVAISGSNRLYWRTDFRRVNYVYSQADAGEDVDKYIIIKYGHYNAIETGAEEHSFGKLTYSFTEYNTAGAGGIKDHKYLSRMGGIGNVNWIVYRISDVMLMKAEALTLLGGEEELKEATDLVKAVYNRSQMGYMDNSGKVIGDFQNSVDNFEVVTKAKKPLELVLDERQRELAFEGKRWYDLVRVALRDNTTSSDIFTKFVNNKYEGMNTQQYSAKMATIDQLFFPIAERELKTNSGLVQNEAYKKENEIEKN